MVILAYNLVQPEVKPCPANSPEIPPPGILTSALDLFLEECASVIGEVSGKDSEGLIIGVDRGEYRANREGNLPGEPEIENCPAR